MEPLLVTAALYAKAYEPSVVLIEVRKNHVPVRVVPARVAHELGQAMASIGTAAEGIDRVLTRLATVGGQP